MRFNIIISIIDVSENGGKASFRHVLHAEDISKSEVPYEVHKARLIYPQDLVLLEPARFYTPEEFGFII